jgi:GNAT superfamily N-acetyltransferase
VTVATLEKRAETGTGVTIRPFAADTDYTGYAEVVSAVYPEYPETAEELRYHDERRDAKLKWARFVAVEEGHVVGVGGYGQSSGMYHPRKFHVDVYVRPEAQGRGIGGRLYAQVIDALAPHDPIALRAEAREDHKRHVRFLTDRGFVEEMREQESKLDMAAFDPAPFADEVESVKAQGIVIKTVAELLETDPDMKLKLHQLHWAIAQDIPHSDTPTQVPFEEWAKRFTTPNFLPEANFVALDGDRYVGTSVLWRTLSNDDLNTGMTGVIRDYRKRGIATALKVRALTLAKERGTPAVRTWNEVNNNGMLGINFRLGFVRQPAWIMFAKKGKEEA